jgi:lipid II:glycine glycyltransferase (peptidoglycan interpeptide bridge formation enzyme)
MDYQFLTPDNGLWDEVLRQCRHDFYCQADYIRLEANRQGAQAEAIYLQQEGCIFFLPYLVRSCEAMSHQSWDITSVYGYPGLLLNAEAKKHPDFVYEAFSRTIELLRERDICTAFIRLHPILNAHLNEQVFGKSYTPLGELVWIDLEQSAEHLWSQTIAKHRNRINHCKRSNFFAEMVPIQQHLDEFIEIYQATMDRVGATSTYYFGKAYFEKLVEIPGVHLCLVRQENCVASAGLFLECNGIVQFHLSGTHLDFLKQAPSKLMLDFVRNWAKSRGNSIFHLGGGVGSARDSLFDFKAGFSPLRCQFAVLKLIVNEPLYLSLVETHAQAMQLPSRQLMESAFFPAYRAA